MRLSACPIFVTFLGGTLAIPSFRLPFVSSTSLTPLRCSLSGMTGVPTDGGACRYTIKYAEVAERWGYSYIVPTFE
jgi:hypothetical protein